MEILIGLFLISFVLLLVANLYFQSEKSILQYIIPISVIIISFVLIGSAFITDSWDISDFGAIGFVLFIASALSIAITAMISNIKILIKTYWG